MSHTPAPWVASIRRFPDGSPADVNIMHGRLRIGGVSVRPETLKAVEANAHLMSSAPDLLIALKGLISPDGHSVYATSDVIERARAAIAKAEGR